MGQRPHRGSQAHMTRGYRDGGSDEGDSGPLGYTAGPGDPVLKLRVATGTSHSPFRDRRWEVCLE